MPLNDRIDTLIDVVPHPDKADAYVGQPHHHTDRDNAVLYGGLLLGQATKACALYGLKEFGPSYQLHSFKAQFLRRANAHTALDYRPKILRKGRSFANVELQTRQSDREILSYSASFHTNEKGFAHQLSLSSTSPTTDEAAITPMDSDLRNIKIGDNEHKMRFSMPIPAWIDPRHSQIRIKDGQAHLQCWMRALKPVGNNAVDQLAAMVYLSDYCTMATVVLPHDQKRRSDLFVVSLDHVLWCYATPNVNQWHLYDMTSPISQDGRGLSLGKIYGQDGKLWAVFAQEGLMRHNN